MINIFLSSQGFANIHSCAHDSTEFEFILYSNESKSIFKVPRYFAEFISPNVSRILLTDSTINSYKIELNNDKYTLNKNDSSDNINNNKSYQTFQKIYDCDDNFECEYDCDNNDQLIIKYSQTFKKFLDILKGNPFKCKENEYQLAYEIAQKLGNREIIHLLTDELEKQINDENVIKRIISKRLKKQNFDLEVKYLASNLYNFNVERLKLLDYETLNLILDSPYLKIKNEESLFDMIFDLTYEIPLAFNLFEYIQFEYLSPEKMNEFVSNFDSEDITGSIWKKICYRLTETTIRQSNDRRFTENPRYLRMRHDCLFNGVNTFDGIFQYLNRLCNGNSHKKSLITISSSGDYSVQSYQVINKDWNSSWSTKNIEGSWWKVDFKNRNVSLCAYSIKTGFGGVGSPHLRNWRMEGSVDDVVWEVIDDKKLNNDLDGPCYSHTWECTKSPPYRFIRLLGTGPNHYNNNQVFFSSIEFFGTVYE
ncbi:hypothetical protein TRFO_40731 [Tritrichomonas foetus]|uniref:F5/8 type C domain-containing protein n=1 Tax=Tritrichomonas foetus TaxID=1144522 RepID=A0A1J4J6W6_9EUKA|nr:hypothetical protein TRFO_40731 [Tritrichomonas foetus]|eukprot:OHS92924.1 hypothetical protein TRFO_40731 [Tritrichomonas foetus]